MKIQKLKEDLINLGLKDNLNLALLLYLSATVSKTRYKISVLVNGPAGLGKSHLAKTVLDLFPSEDIITNSRMTPASLVRHGDLRKKILYIYEKFIDPQFAQYIRELLTEGEVVYSTAKGEHRLLGPTTVIETTVNSEIFGIENRSRCFVAGINRSQDAIDNIFRRQKMLMTIKGLETEQAFKFLQDEHHNFQRKLDYSLRVIIPFGEDIQLTSRVYHSPRIVTRIRHLISAIAFLNQEERSIEGSGEFKYIEANRDDFNEAKQILTDVPLEEDDVILPRDVIEFIEALRRNRPALSQNTTFSRNKAMEVLHDKSQFHSYKVITKYLKILASLGFIDVSALPGLRNQIGYSFSEEFPIGSSENLAKNCYSTLSLS